MSIAIHVNNVFQQIDGCPQFEQPCRIIWIDREIDCLVFITIDDEPKQPWVFELSVLNDLIRDHKVTRVEWKVPDFMLALESEISEKHRTIRDAGWARIKALVDAPREADIYFPGRMGALINSHARATGVERKTLYRLLYRYWMLGSVRNALLPQYIRSGAKGASRQYSNGKLPGRPPRAMEIGQVVRAMVLSEQDKAIIKVGYALYKNSEVKTITDAYTRTLRHYYCEAIATPEFPENVPVLKPIEQLPTPRQFDYWGKKAFDDIAVLRSRKGERKWAKDHRHLSGRAGQGLFGPCHRFEIDATIADIYLVSRFNRNWIIGRPVVYVIVDVFSRMIVGIFVGLEGPSWNGARQALLNAFSDKVAFCAEHGIPISQQDWPCFHLPQEICADRGEMLGLAAEGIVSGLGIDLAIAPPYRPDWKAVVESRFRILNQLTQIHWTPGGVAERIKERGQRDYRLDATLDLKEFTKIIIASVLHYNHHSRRPELLNQDMIASGIEATPIGLWNWGIDHGFGTPNERAAELVRLHLMGKSVGSVQAGGIFFGGMYYVPEDGADSSRFSRARAKGQTQIDIWHDPTRPEEIWIRSADKSLRRCIWRASEVRYEGHRFEEILDMLELTKHVPPAQRHADLASKVKLDAHIQTTINNAVAEKAQIEKPSSQAEQLANIRGNRAIERAAERSAVPMMASVPPQKLDSRQPSSVASESFGERGAEVINILSKLQRKGKV